MLSNPIQFDTSSRGWISRWRYPVALVQIFSPCDWSDFAIFIGEDERFQDVFKDRVAWLLVNKIRCNIRYHMVDQVLDQSTPRVYRLITEFSNNMDATAYIERWDKWDCYETSTLK